MIRAVAHLNENNATIVHRGETKAKQRSTKCGTIAQQRKRTMSDLRFEIEYTFNGNATWSIDQDGVESGSDLLEKIDEANAAMCVLDIHLDDLSINTNRELVDSIEDIITALNENDEPPSNLPR